MEFQSKRIQLDRVFTFKERKFIQCALQQGMVYLSSNEKWKEELVREMSDYFFPQEEQISHLRSLDKS